MSEKMHSGGEGLQPKLDLSVESHKNLERIQQEAKELESNKPEQIEKLKVAAEQQALSGKEITVGERQEHTGHTGPVPKELKQVAYQRSLNHVRSRLSAPKRTLSHIIHQPVIERASDISARTIARPSGILAGGLFSAIGSLVVLYMAKHYGFSYNYLLFVFLFAGGFLVGLIVELFVKLIFRKSRA